MQEIFQSTPPRRRRRGFDNQAVINKLFQSTPPRRRRLLLLLVSTFPQDFNPRLREGGDGFYWSKHCKRCLISIHASAKEATFEHLLYVLDEHIFQSTPPRRRRPISSRSRGRRSQEISIHASAKEATFLGRCCTLCLNFNPRLREGGDSLQGLMTSRNLSISIHASAKEATLNH